LLGIRYSYVMRSTRREADGHYSDPPMLVLTSLAAGPKLATPQRLVAIGEPRLAIA